MADVSLKDQVREVGREVGIREMLYPRWVKEGRITQQEADTRLAAMRAVYETLKAQAETAPKLL